MAQPLTIGTRSAGWETVSLAQERRLNGMYIIGKNGMGKSVTMLSMIVQDIVEGDGCCVIDPHGDLVKDAIAYIPEERRQDVIYWNARDAALIPGFDLFALSKTDNVIKRSNEINRIVAAFLKAAPATNAHRMENLLRLIVVAFLDNPGYTLAEMKFLIDNESFRRHLVGNIHDPMVRDDWERLLSLSDAKWQDHTESSLTRIRKFTTDPLIQLIVGQQGKTIDFRACMDNGKLVFITMPENEELANLLGTLIVDRLLAATLSRGDTHRTERRLFGVYVDEFSRFQTDDFARFFTEGRKYAVPTTVAHQARWQLGGNDLAPRAAHNWLLFKCEYEDAAVLGRGMPVPYEKPPEPLSPEDAAMERLYDTFGFSRVREVMEGHYFEWEKLTPDEIHLRICIEDRKPLPGESLPRAWNDPRNDLYTMYDTCPARKSGGDIWEHPEFYSAGAPKSRWKTASEEPPYRHKDVVIIPTRPPGPENPWKMLSSQGHPEVDIALLGQTVAEGIGELDDAWQALAQARNYSTTRAAFDREQVRVDYQWVRTIRESLERDLGLFLEALTGEDEEDAWNSGFRIVRDDVRWRGLEWAGSAKLLRELGLRTDQTRVADKLLKDIEQLGKRWQKHYHWEEPVSEEEDAGEGDEGEEPKAPAQRELAQRLSNLTQFHFLFRFLNEQGETESVWAETKIPPKPPANPHLDEWIAEWSRQSGSPPEEIEAQIARRQARFRGRDSTTFHDEPAPPIPQPKATPFKRPY